MGFLESIDLFEVLVVQFQIAGVEVLFDVSSVARLRDRVDAVPERAVRRG
jgi:hypothetical protein